MSEPHLTEPLWRAIAVYRVASLGYAVALVATIDRHNYSRLDWAWAVLAAMASWTAVSTVGYSRPERRDVPLLTVDLMVTAGLLVSTWGLQFPADLHRGVMPVTATWVAGPVLAWAVRYGWQAGLPVALVLSGCDFALRGGAAGTITVTLDGAVLMVLAGVIVGYLARLAAAVERERQHAIEVEAASRERERLARAAGYLVKSAARPEFLDAVRRTADGDAVFTPGLAGLVLGEFRRWRPRRWQRASRRRG